MADGDPATLEGSEHDSPSRTLARPSAIDVLPALLALAVVVASWAAVTAVLAIPPYLLPEPGSVAARLLGDPGLYAAHALATLELILLGGTVGVAGGLAVAVAVVSVPLLRHALLPYVVTVRVLPKVAIAPALVIYFGTGRSTAVAFVAAIAFFPIALATIAGLDRPIGRYEDLLRSVDADPVRAFLAVRLRLALPELFAGLKQSVTLAVVGAVVAEWVVVDDGLGSLVLLAAENLATDVLLAALVVLVVEGLALYGLVALAERRLCWYDRPV